MKVIFKSIVVLCLLATLIVIGCKKNDPGKSCNNAVHAGYTSLDSDACGDGVNASLLDGTRLEYKYDATSDSIWFLVSVNSITATQPIGVNLLVNIPNGGNTFNFWGNDNKNAFNRLLTVWVTGTAPSAYSGIIGIADAAGVTSGNGGAVSGYTDLSQNNIGINVNTSNGTILLGLKRADLVPDTFFAGANITVKIAAAVGSNAAYNDDIYHANTTMTLPKFVPAVSLPVVTTTAATAITGSGATTGGTVTSDGGSAISDRGVVVSTSPNPTIADLKINASGTTGAFTSVVSGLSPNTVCYARAYATNSAGTSYGNQIIFTTLVVCATSVADVDGNTYGVVKIGKHCWTTENLKTTRYNDGANIPNVRDSASWADLTTGGYCAYDNVSANIATYAPLYNWYTVGTGRLCPTGWHVPSDSDWHDLITDLGGGFAGTFAGAYTVVGGPMKSTSSLWTSPNTGATNSSGFSAVPGGDRTEISLFSYKNDEAGFWSSTANGANAYRFLIYYSGTDIDLYPVPQNTGFSVRCVAN